MVLSVLCPLLRSVLVLQVRVRQSRLLACHTSCSHSARCSQPCRSRRSPIRKQLQLHRSRHNRRRCHSHRRTRLDRSCSKPARNFYRRGHYMTGKPARADTRSARQASTQKVFESTFASPTSPSISCKLLGQFWSRPQSLMVTPYTPKIKQTPPCGDILTHRNPPGQINLICR